MEIFLPGALAHMAYTYQAGGGSRYANRELRAMISLGNVKA